MEPLEVHRKDWRSMIAMGLSALGTLFFLVKAITFSALLLISNLNSQINTDENSLFGLLIWYSLLSGVLLIPVFLFSLYDYREKPIPTWMDTIRHEIKKRLLWLILLLPAIIFIGWLVAGQPTLSVFILGLNNIMVVGIPVLWLCTVAQSQLNGGSRVRKWRIFGFSLTVLPFLVIFIEILAFLILFGFGGIIIAYRMSVNPLLEHELMFFIDQISLNRGNLDKIFQLLEPYIIQPSVIFWVFAIFSGVIPLIEEFIKPIALWSLAGSDISPQEGFVGGLLCGAGFSLMENLLYFNIAVTAEEWLFMSIGRIGTTALHMLASGLIGWGLAITWREGKWLPLMVMTLGSIFLHGFWNALALLSGIFPLFIGTLEVTPIQKIIFNLPLVLLFFVSVMGIFLINHYFRKGEKSQALITHTNIEQEGVADDVS
ncbi:MAG: PrsW family glutamic-type intramembrane protease [Chloroflexota bacterium]|nr:PrsW family glutamic-type intramembrane protease [Chloroflexota bacterium]